MRPIIMGAVMALVMLAMLHKPIMAGTMTLSAVSVGFVLAHLAVLGIGLGLVALLPGARKLAVRHRPGLRHLAGMAAGVVMAAGTVHILMHGGWA